MKQKLLLAVALLVGLQVFAETSLVVYPMSEAEQATALSTIGYVKLRNDSMFLYSKADFLLGSNRLSEIRKVTFEERSKLPTQLDDAQSVTSVRVYPNPTSDALVIQNANSDVARIFNLKGQIVLTATIYDGSATLNVSSLPMGTYLLQLNTELVKFIKQ